ncbi:MAG TPA: hypothetical protein VMT69_02655 [Kineosporiaceae bacterium]|nr:hypothetical protein [Kineosporiaceae bacterium]
MSATEREIATQPDCWRRAARLGVRSAVLPKHGEHVAVVGCGTSWFVGQACAALREQRGLGRTDAFAASLSPAAVTTTACWSSAAPAPPQRLSSCSMS